MSSNSTSPATSDSSAQSSTVASSITSELSSTQGASTTTVPASSTTAAATSTATAQSSAPSTTFLSTSVVTIQPTESGQSASASTVVVTQITTASNSAAQTSDASGTASGSSSTSSSTDPATLQSGGKSSTSSGLSPAGKTAIAVVVPVVVVALLVGAGIWFWRKRKERKTAEEARRKEVEEYGFNPNHDPTLPAVGGGVASEMTEDGSGYRGWGTTSSNRKASTTISGNVTGGLSDSGSQPGGYHSPGSPVDDRSGDPLMGTHRRPDSDNVGELGAGPAAGANRAGGVARGPSNASSSYSAGDRSDNSGEHSVGHGYSENQYYQPNPYGDQGYGHYGGGEQPVIRDVTARRNTRIQNPSVFPQQGNSGIAQNF